MARNSAGEFVAVKFYPSVGGDGDILSNSLIDGEFEALNALATVQNHGVVRCFEKGKRYMKINGVNSGRKIYIVVEYLPGGTLLDLCRNVALGTNMARFIFKELAIKLQTVHMCGLTHLDVKLENTMIDADGRITIMDFGFAYKHEGNGLGRFNGKIGSPIYMAPEILLGKDFVGHEADVFSLGVILFSMAFRRFPFDNATSDDNKYKYFFKRKILKFWTRLQEALNFPLTSEVQWLMHLLTGMLACTPESRMSLPEVLAHPWVANMPLPTEAEARTFIKHSCDLT